MRALIGGIVVVLLAGGAACAKDARQPQDSTPSHPVRQRPARANALEQRVQLLTHELDLDTAQQQAVRRILLGQREAVRRIWEDGSIAPEHLASAVRHVVDQTADRIRAVLSEEQRKKYNRPLPDDALSTRTNADVEGWLRTVRGQSSGNPLGVALPTGR